MKIQSILAIFVLLALVACRPSAPDTPDPEAYGKTIQPFHQIPAGDQEGGGKPRPID